MPIAHNGWAVYRGMVREWDLDLVDPDTNQPLGLGGATIRYRMAQSYSGPPLISSAGDPIVHIVDEATGQIRIKLSPSDTAALPYGRVVHQIIIEDDAQDTEVLLEGYGEVLPVIRAS